MKKYLIFPLFILSFISCEPNLNKCYQHEDFIKEFSKGVQKDPPTGISIFFAKLSDGNTLMTNNLFLYKLYNEQYIAKIDFTEFLCELYNEKIVLNDSITRSWNPDNVIFNYDKIFDEESIKSLEKLYTINRGNYLLLKNKINDSFLYSILFKFFKNKYYISFDDVGGFYTIRHNLVMS